MTDEKILSVSVAAYNVAATLAEALDPFIESGMLEALDVMIIDDGSKDQTRDVAGKYVEKYPNTFRLISKENGGWGSTVNYGIRYARGKYFKQLDGDDYYLPENMPWFIETLRELSTDLVVSPYNSFESDTGNIIAHENCNPGCPYNQEIQIGEITGFYPFMHSLAVRTDLLKGRVDTITEHCFYTDMEFVLKACNYVNTVIFLDKEIYCYRRAAEGQSMSLSGFEKHYMEQYKVIEVLLDYEKSNVRREEIIKVFDNVLFGTCMWQYLIMLYIRPTSQRKKDLIAFDKMLKEKAPDFYERTNIGTINALRKTAFLGYSFAARHKFKKDNRFDEQGRMKA